MIEVVAWSQHCMTESSRQEHKNTLSTLSRPSPMEKNHQPLQFCIMTESTDYRPRAEQGLSWAQGLRFRVKRFGVQRSPFEPFSQLRHRRKLTTPRGSIITTPRLCMHQANQKKMDPFGS